MPKTLIDPSDRLYAAMRQDVAHIDDAAVLRVLFAHGWQRKPEFETGSIQVWHSPDNKTRVTLPPVGDDWRNTTLCELIGTFAYTQEIGLFRAMKLFGADRG